MTLPPGKWQIADTYAEDAPQPQRQDSQVIWKNPGEWNGCVVHLRKN